MPSSPADAVMTVTGKRVIADDVVELRLSPADGQTPPWAPGAHVDLVWHRRGTSEDNLVRQYSLCGDPDDSDALTVAVLRDREGRGGSNSLHDYAVIGDSMVVRGPRNHFVLQPAPGYLFVAGGIGITPLIPMVMAAERAGATWRLVYGGRKRSSMAYLTELTAIAATSAVGEIEVYPVDEAGPIDLDVLSSGLADGDLVYCCGPESLLEAVEGLSHSWPAGTLHLERFNPRERTPEVPDEQFQVECAVTGVTLTVDPGTSILHAAHAAGIDVLSSCEAGTCGTCETVVLDGEPDHRDSVLGPQERKANDVMMICCSRAQSPLLVLEL